MSLTLIKGHWKLKFRLYHVKELWKQLLKLFTTLSHLALFLKYFDLNYLSGLAAILDSFLISLILFKGH